MQNFSVHRMGLLLVNHYSKKLKKEIVNVEIMQLQIPKYDYEYLKQIRTTSCVMLRI